MQIHQIHDNEIYLNPKQIVADYLRKVYVGIYRKAIPHICSSIRKTLLLAALRFSPAFFKSASVLRRTNKEHLEFRVNSHRYCAASSLEDSKTIVLDSLTISSSMVFQPSLSRSALHGVSKLRLYR